MVRNLRPLLIAILSIIINIAYAQSPTNIPCDAPTITASNTPGVCNNFSFDVCCAGSTSGYTNFLGKSPRCGASPFNYDAWFKLGGMTAGVQYNFIYIEKDERQTWVEIYELPAGKDCNVPSNYLPIVCTRENDVIVFKQSTASATFIPANATSTYYMRLMRANSTGPLGLGADICLVASYSNDEPCGAKTLPIQPAVNTSPMLGENITAADWQPNIYTGPTCGPNNDVWFKFIAQDCSADIYVKNLSPLTYEVQAAILESADGTCNNLKEVTPCGGAKNTYNDIKLSTNGLTIGRTYYVIVDGFSPPYNNATGKFSIEVVKRANPPKCADVPTPCDCAKPAGCSNPTPFPNSTTANIALSIAQNSSTASGCIDLAAYKIPLIKGSNKAEFCANYTAAADDDYMAFDNVLHKDGACEVLIDKNVVYEAGNCNNTLTPACTDINAISKVYRLTPGKTYKFCLQVTTNGSDLDCIGKYYQSFCAFLWKVNNKYTINKTICNGETYTFDNKVLNKTGAYTATFIHPITNCDSIVTLNLNVLPKIASALTVNNICPEKGYKFGDDTYYTTGTYVKVFKSKEGCDSTVTLQLNVLPKQEVNINKTICYEDKVTIGNNVFNQSGTYRVDLTSSKGCDSTVTLFLVVRPPIRKTINATICFGEKYIYKNKTFDKSGVYTLDTLNARNGCDSVLSLNLNILRDYSNEKISASICYNQSYFFGETNYTTSGVYTYTYKTKYLNLKCDSTVTLTLSVTDTIKTDIKQVLCYGGTVKIGDVIYDTTGKYKKTFKTKSCDSIVTLDLTVRPKVKQIDDSETICKGERTKKYPGHEYAQAGVYDVVLKYPEPADCDSARITYTVKVIEPIEKKVQGYLCTGTFTFRGKNYTKEGVERDTLLSSITKCPDTIYVIDIKKDKNIVLSLSPTAELCKDKKDGKIISSVANAKTPISYKWSNGATDKDISNLIGNTTYALTVTDADGCTATAQTALETKENTYTINTSATSSSCDVAKNGTATVNVTPAASGYKYQWSNNGNTATINNLLKGTYTVTVTDANGCTSVTSVEVTAENNPVSIVKPQNDTIVQGGFDTLKVITTPSSGLQFSWSPKSGLDNKSGNTFVVSSNSKDTKEFTEYSITVTDANGCSATTTFNVYVDQLKIPTIFTPLSDDVNNTFKPAVIPKGIKILSCSVLDRWGVPVFNYNPAIGKWWDGTANDRELPSDVYVYILTYQIIGVNVLVQLDGNVTLLR